MTTVLKMCIHSLSTTAAAVGPPPFLVLSQPDDSSKAAAVRRQPSPPPRLNPTTTKTGYLLHLEKQANSEPQIQSAGSNNTRSSKFTYFLFHYIISVSISYSCLICIKFTYFGYGRTNMCVDRNPSI